MCTEIKNLFYTTSHKLLIILFFVFLTQFTVARNQTVVSISNMVCNPVDLKYIQIAQCKLKALRPDIIEVTVQCILLQKPIDNITLWSTVRKRGVVLGKPLLEFRVDFCAFLRNKRRNLLAEFAYQIMGLQEWSNLNHTCPYDHDIILDKYRFDGRSISRLTPLTRGQYTFVFKWFTYNVLRLIVKVHFQIHQ